MNRYYICDWCQQDHIGFRPNSSSCKQLYKAIQETGLIHVFISNSTGPCPICGVDTETRILPIPGPAHPATPIHGHAGVGCMGPWTHNKELMEHNGLTTKPLPCDDPHCNEVWKELIGG